FRLFLAGRRWVRNASAASAAAGMDTQIGLMLGQCMASIAYGQLIAENAARLEVAAEMVSVIFGLLVEDLSALALKVASLSQLRAVDRVLLRRMVAVARTGSTDWDAVARQMDAR